MMLTYFFIVSIWLGRTAAQPDRPPPSSSSERISPPYPYSGQDTFCPGRKPRFLNDPCSEDEPCYNGDLTSQPISLECTNGRCSCVYNYVPSSLKNGLCEPAPTLDSPCYSACEIPLVCREEEISSTMEPESGSSTVENEETSEGPSTMTPPEPGSTLETEETTGSPSTLENEGTTEIPSTMSPSSSKTCQCAPPYVLRGSICKLDCPPDQFYDQNDGKCKPQCKQNEVKLNNGYCAPVAKLGEECQDELQCRPQYSTCKNGTCSCEPGFQIKNQECVPEEYSCPWSKPLEKDGEVLECNITNQDYPAYQENDSCPSNAYCLTGPSSAVYPNSVQYGFCCPKPNLKCPVGKPIENTNCGAQDFYYRPRPGPSSSPPKPCPSQSHYCYTVAADANTYRESLCCPEACDDQFVLVDGQCYQEVKYGEQCVVDEQCASFNGLCENGTCQCPASAEPVDLQTTDSECVVYCDLPRELRINNKCYKRRKLGDQCGDDPANLCPDNAGCDPNGGNTCQCKCNYVTIGDNRCEEYPVCLKNYQYPQYQPVAGESVENTTPNDETSTTTSYETTQGPSPSPAPQGNFTFCRWTGIDPPVEAVENCPEEEFCNYYLTDLGMCCPIPDPVCEDGSGGTEECTFTEPDSCPDGQFCYTYYNAVGGEPDHGSICCPGVGSSYDYHG